MSAILNMTDGSRRIRLVATAFLSLAGIADSAYLGYEHIRGGTYYCAGLGDCDFVNSSPYAEIAGVPVALLGLALYAAILSIALCGLRGQSDAVFTVVPLLLFGLGLAGILASAFFTYVELYILHAI